MSPLGYKGTSSKVEDFGGPTLRHMARDVPDPVTSVFSNAYPNATDLQREALNQTTAMENSNIANLSATANSNGFAAIQATALLQLAVGMTDSPVGTAAWIYDVMYVGARGLCLNGRRDHHLGDDVLYPRPV